MIGHAIDRYGWICHAYCLMGNHYHLLIETPRANLSPGMRQLNGLYARYFNDRHVRCGHVFQARFGSTLVEKNEHLLNAARYIVLNPVEAGLCTHPSEWPWSSYRATAGYTTAPAFLDTDWLLAQFAPTRKLAQARYRDFVDENLELARAAAATIGQRLGSESFLRNTFGFDPPLPEIPRIQIEPLPPTLAEIFHSSNPTPVAAAYRRHGYTLQQIAAFLGCHYSTISRRLRNEETQLTNNQKR
jgi:putative transposase